MTTLEALQGMERALERIRDELPCHCYHPENPVADHAHLCPKRHAALALAAWRSRTPLAGDEVAVLAAAKALINADVPGIGRAWRWEDSSPAAQEEAIEAMRAALAAIDALLASPTERTVKP